MLTLSQILRLHTRSIDFTLVYVQAPINVDIYLELPQGFDVDGNQSQYVQTQEKPLWTETGQTILVQNPS